MTRVGQPQTKLEVRKADPMTRVGQVWEASWSEGDSILLLVLTERDDEGLVECLLLHADDHGSGSPGEVDTWRDEWFGGRFFFRSRALGGAP